MSVEVVTTINTLDATFPTSTDPRSEGDDHIRNIKLAVKTTFPNVAGVVSVSHTDLNNITTTQAVADESTKPATTAFVKLKVDSQIQAAVDAGLALAGATVATASMWVSGSYTTGTVVWSPADGQNYRRKSPGGASVTDPASDPTNWYAITSLISLPVSRISIDTTAIPDRHYLIAASLILTLPASPVSGDVIEFTNVSNTQTATINPNGQKIRGDSSVMLIDSLNATAVLTYSGATDGWV
jgi:hypothetical protein